MYRPSPFAYGGGMGTYGGPLGGGGYYGAGAVPPFGDPLNDPYRPPGMPPTASGAPPEHWLWSSLNRVGAFSRSFLYMSYVLDSNFHALNASWTSMVRLVEGLSSYRRQLLAAVRALLALKIIHAATQMARVARRRRTMALALLFGGGGTWLLLAPFFKSAAAPVVANDDGAGNDDEIDDDANNDDDAAAAEDDDVARTHRRLLAHTAALVGHVAVVVHAYEARHADELSVRRGDKVLALALADDSDGWLAAEREDCVRGLVPATHLRLLKKRAKEEREEGRDAS